MANEENPKRQTKRLPSRGPVDPFSRSIPTSKRGTQTLRVEDKGLDKSVHSGLSAQMGCGFGTGDGLSGGTDPLVIDSKGDANPRLKWGHCPVPVGVWEICVCVCVSRSAEARTGIQLPFFHWDTENPNYQPWELRVEGRFPGAKFTWRTPKQRTHALFSCLINTTAGSVLQTVVCLIDR